MSTIKVLLVDDHQIMRHGLQALLEQVEDIEVVAHAASGEEAIQLTQNMRPDVIVMDLTMPGIGGIEATRRIVAEHPATKILALSMVKERNCVVESLKAGARGYLVKDCAAEELVEAVRSLCNGRNFLCSQVSTLLVEHYNKRQPAGPPDSQLSERETRVLALIADGLNTKEIAFRLNVSNKTIETQRASIMKKLGLFSIAELTKYALQQGLTKGDPTPRHSP